MRSAKFTFFLALTASKVAIANSHYNLTSGVTPVSHQIFNLHMTILWICVAIGIIVFGVMGYSIVYHRKSAGAKAAHFHEHLSLELTWTFIPLLILILMAIPATKVLINLSDYDQPDLTIKITGYQWKWKYEYLDQHISFFSNINTPFDELSGKKAPGANYLLTVDHPLVIPLHKKIRFLVTSNDVIHSWWVPDFGVKRDAIPGFINEAWTRVNRPGEYHGQCAELCGINHAYMPIVVQVVPENAFNSWVAQQKGLASPAVTTPVKITTVETSTTTTTQAVVTKKYTLEELMKQGEQVYLGTCSACHQATGLGLPPTFPAMKGSKIATGSLKDHLDIVLNGKPGTAMQAFRDQLSDMDLAAVITYERNAWGNNTGTSVQPDEVKAAR
jgi:cytochrome c oxidase subunit 2